MTNTAPGQCVSAPITFAPTVGDNCPGTTVVSVPPSGSTFAKGTNIVTSTVTDAAGNTNSCSFTVIVVDQEAPTITCPANIVTTTTPGQCVSAPVTFTPTVGDNCPGTSVVSVPPSGSTFAKGTNIVTSTVTDAAGNTNSCSFTVIVVDQEAPTITCPANIVTTTTPGQCVSAPITFAPTVGDNCPGATVVSVPPSGSTFAKGTNIVTSTVTDVAGNTNSCSFTVIVVDQEAPTITCPTDIITNATSAAGTVVTFAAPVVSDNCPGVTISNASGSLVSGDIFPIGTTMVTRYARDAAGNVTSCSFTVTVGGPRDDFDTARAEIQALRDETTDPAELKQLDRVLTLLTLSDTYWDDEVNLDAKDGKKVFSVVKTTIKTLEKFIAKSPNLPDAPMQAVIDRLVAAGRVVANLAITEATSAGADPAALAKANAAYAAGLWEINNGTPGNANKYLQKAWTLATKALAKLD
ncbi:MAG: hypothetical protein PCFJNLEI_04024 [Verrucomicrobiae bacterium]|nr:hypothetical protein [Verrucomicrobiae bacterium]